MRRLLPVLALSAAVMLGACQNPDGTVNVPASLALGAGVALAGVAIASANDGPRHNHYRQPRYGRPHYGHGHGYRRW
jgi:hypothetical protein